MIPNRAIDLQIAAWLARQITLPRKQRDIHVKSIGEGMMPAFS
jgi:hypothetical protein